MNKIDEIKRLKELLDANAITQVEFNTLKKEILANTELSKSEYVPYVSKAKQKALLNNALNSKESSTSIKMIDDGRNSRTFNNPINSIIYNMKTITLKVIGITILFVIIAIATYTNSSNSSTIGSASSSSSQYAELHCPWCKSVQKASGGGGLVYYKYKRESGGVSWNEFYDGIKYECCSEDCCRLYHGATKNY